MKRVIEYRTITATGDGELNVEVNAYIEEGWQPLGGPSMGVFPHFNPTQDVMATLLYSQAMVKYVD